MVGSIVWICHYNRPDLNKKPLRNLPPTKVIVMANYNLPEGKRVYYSQNHFRAIGKNGEATKKVISPVDNTGFRSNCGNELHVFDNEADCIKSWNEQIDECCSRLKERELSAVESLKKEREALLNQKA